MWLHKVSSFYDSKAASFCPCQSQTTGFVLWRSNFDLSMPSCNFLGTIFSVTSLNALIVGIGMSIPTALVIAPLALPVYPLHSFLSECCVQAPIPELTLPSRIQNIASRIDIPPFPLLFWWSSSPFGVFAQQQHSPGFSKCQIRTFWTSRLICSTI